MHVIFHNVLHRKISYQSENKDTPFHMEVFSFHLLNLKNSFDIYGGANEAEQGYL